MSSDTKEDDVLPSAKSLPVKEDQQIAAEEVETCSSSSSSSRLMGAWVRLLYVGKQKK